MLLILENIVKTLGKSQIFSLSSLVSYVWTVLVTETIIQKYWKVNPNFGQVTKLAASKSFCVLPFLVLEILSIFYNIYLAVFLLWALFSCVSWNIDL